MCGTEHSGNDSRYSCIAKTRLLLAKTAIGKLLVAISDIVMHLLTASIWGGKSRSHGQVAGPTVQWMHVDSCYNKASLLVTDEPHQVLFPVAPTGLQCFGTPCLTIRVDAHLSSRSGTGPALLGPHR